MWLFRGMVGGKEDLAEEDGSLVRVPRVKYRGLVGCIWPPGLWFPTPVLNPSATPCFTGDSAVSNQNGN